MDCIFCKIVKGEASASKVYEDDEVLGFMNIKPEARIHVLIIPKKHIESVKTLEPADAELVGKLFLAAKDIAKERGLEGYKLAINVGREGGQIVDHMHLHLLSSDISMGI
jgi:histidine triad (HIT) family protein